MGEGERDETKQIVKTMDDTTKTLLTKQFLTRYKRVSRRNLSWDVTIKRTRRIGPRNRCTRKDKKVEVCSGNLLSWEKN